jgi:hypothetical protein
MSVNLFRRRKNRSSARRRRALTIEQLEGRVLMANTYLQPEVDASPEEQYMLELVNRMRMEPQLEVQRLLAVHDGDVDFAISDYNVDKSLLSSQFANLAPAPPLAWNNTLGKHAALQSDQMYTQDKQFHHGKTFLQELENDGYYVGVAKDQNGNPIKAKDENGNPIKDENGNDQYVVALKENVYAEADSVFHAHAAFAIDWGDDEGGSVGGMQSKLGHRSNIMDPQLREVGIGILNNVAKKPNSGPVVVTQDFADPSDPDHAFITGVCYNDMAKNENKFYDVGEGVYNCFKTVHFCSVFAIDEASGDTYAARPSKSSGGYTIKVPKGRSYYWNTCGQYTTDDGGGAAWAGGAPGVSIGNENVKRDSCIYDKRGISTPDAGSGGTPDDRPDIPEMPPDQPDFGEFSGAGMDMIIYGPGWEDGIDAYLRIRTDAPVYVKGTDAFDKVTISRESDSQATLTMQSFRDARFTRPIDGPLTYTFDIGDEGILVESGSGHDLIVLDPAIAAKVTVNAGDGDDLINVGSPAAGSNVTVHGGAGTDQITLTGTAGEDTAVLRPGSVDLTGRGYQVRARGVENARVDGGSGKDVALLYDNPDAEDTLHATPEEVAFSGAGFDNQAVNFRYTHAYATPGSGDVAFLRGASGQNDTFEAWPDMARLFGADYYNRVKSFRWVHGYSTPGDRDVAFLHDASGQNDTFEAWPDMARLYGAGFYNRVKSFRYVHGYGTPGDKDVALLRGDPAATDKFQAWPQMARLYGGNYYNRVKSFAYVHGYGTPGTRDSAYLHGSRGNDTLVSADYASRLYGSGFNNRAVSFDQIEADGAGGADRARLHDAVLEAGRADYPDVDDILWLSQFDQIDQHDTETGEEISTEAVDAIFTAYWP